jgi:glycosyltransferase involved in cell wall biosynthesis
MGNRFTVYLFALIYYLLHSSSFDYIVDISNGIPFFTPLIAQATGVLLVHHVHGLQWFREFPFPFGVVGWFLESRIVPVLYANWPVIAVSPSTRDDLIELGFNSKKITIVYNGVNIPKEAPVEHVPGKHRIAYVGRLKRYKRIDRLVQHISELRIKLPDIHLDIAGDGDARAQIEALVQQLHLEEHVTLYGYVDEPTKAAILSSADVFATTSMHEGWGLSVIEANAYGCPAVAYDVPGLRMAIQNGETGLLALDDSSYREALLMILIDHGMRNHLSKCARNWAAQFDWDECAKKTLEVLEQWKSKSLTPTYQGA